MSDKVLQISANFARKLYKEINENGENIFFSPLSLHMVLSLLAEGAQGDTKSELVGLLEASNSSAKDNKELLKCLTCNEDVKLALANKIYCVTSGGHELAFVEEFMNVAKNYFESDLESVDFDKKEEAISNVNNWISDRTKGLIKNFLDDLKDPGLLLINAIYFKGNWVDKFEPKGIEDFYCERDKKIPVEMMYRKGCFKYSRDDNINAEIVEIPYKDERYRMIFVIPYEKDNGIRSLEDKLINYNIKEIFNGLKYEQVEIFMPKFKIESTLKLVPTLKKLGVTIAFDKNHANFNSLLHLCGGDNFYVTDVVQKCIIEVNEEGAEAAAASMVIGAFVNRCLMMEPPVQYTIRVDHPAIFMLAARCNEGEDSDVILFYGKLSQPKY